MFVVSILLLWSNIFQLYSADVWAIPWMGLSRRRTQLWLGQKLRTPVFVDSDLSAQAEEFVVLMVPTLIRHQRVKVHYHHKQILVYALYWACSGVARLSLQYVAIYCIYIIVMCIYVSVVLSSVMFALNNYDIVCLRIAVNSGYLWCQNSALTIT